MAKSCIILVFFLLCSPQISLSWGGFGTSYMSTNPDDVGFFLYPNPDNLTDFDELVYSNKSSIENSRFNSSNAIIVMSHGFTQNHESTFPTNVKNAYLAAGFATKANLITVDWGRLSGTIDVQNLPLVLSAFPSYIRASKNVEIVGKRVAEFLVFLMDSKNMTNSSEVHLIGHSLGAHVSGIAGYHFQTMKSESLGRITGTDPAAPLFQWIGNKHRLDSRDADFVDIIHTDQSILGYVGGLGHVDFYVDLGGPIQTTCLTEFSMVTCSHNSAPVFYAKSIGKEILACTHPDKIFKCSAESTILFGEDCPQSTRGTYFLRRSDFA